MERSTASQVVSDDDEDNLNKYCKKETLLGSGGYGEVYRGWYKVDEVKQEVAIKRIPLDKARNFIEAERHLMLRHPNVLRCYSMVLQDLVAQDLDHGYYTN